MQPDTRKEWLKKHGKTDESKRSQDRIAKERAKRRATPPNDEENEENPLKALAEHQQATEMSECVLCCDLCPMDFFRQLMNCGHVFCRVCLKKHVTFSIIESRIEIPCPGCPANIHPADVKDFCAGDNELYAKYEEFSVRLKLIQIPDTRWCPAPDCGFAVIVPDGIHCPRIECLRPGCGTFFCFECKKVWQPARRCHLNRRTIRERQEAEALAETTRPCPGCHTMIHKIEDGSCNHMHCTMCRTEFCWLCLRVINDLHFMSPTGCTFWGKRPWSRKKKLIWQIGSLLGSPVVIAVSAVVSLPLLCGIIPMAVGRKVYRSMKDKPKSVRVLATTAAVAGSAVVSPVVASVTVAICIPLAIGYTYIVVPKALVHEALDYAKSRRNTSTVSVEDVPDDVTEVEYLEDDVPKVLEIGPTPESHEEEDSDDAATSSADYSEEDVTTSSELEDHEATSSVA